MSNNTRRDLVETSTTAIALAGGALMLAMGAARLLKDGSFFESEAGIALSLMELAPGELFGPLLTPHSFPRIYLFAIGLLEDALGYETWVLRLLPFLFFVAASVLALRLFRLRFRRLPLFVALAVVLNLMIPIPFAYAAMVKQYSFDVFLALIPFCLSDRFFDDRLRDGQEPWKLALLALPCATSFTYLIPLLARFLAWYISTWLRGHRRLDPAALATFALATGLSLTSVYLTDLRHTADTSRLFRYWEHCTLGADPEQTGRILRHFFGQWYAGPLPFGRGRALPQPAVSALLAAMALGCVEVLRRALSPPQGGDEARAEWGSRSLACLITLAGTLAASLVVRYPVCAGQLTWFTLFSLHVLTLEGLVLTGSLAKRANPMRWIFQGLLLLLIGLGAEATWRNADYQFHEDTRSNVRPLLEYIQKRPRLPVVVAACSARQIQTLPEWRGRKGVSYWELEFDPPFRDGFPQSGDFWVLSGADRRLCPQFYERLREHAFVVRPITGRDDPTVLLLMRRKQR